MEATDFVFQIENLETNETISCGHDWFPFNGMNEFFDIVDILVTDSDQDVFELITTGLSPVIWAGALMSEPVADWLGETGRDRSIPVHVQTQTRDGRVLFQIATDVAIDTVDGVKYCQVDTSKMGAALSRNINAAHAEGDLDETDRLLGETFPQFPEQQRIWKDMDPDKVDMVVMVTTAGVEGLSSLIRDHAADD